MLFQNQYANEAIPGFFGCFSMSFQKHFPTHISKSKLCIQHAWTTILHDVHCSTASFLTSPLNNLHSLQNWPEYNSY